MKFLAFMNVELTVDLQLPNPKGADRALAASCPACLNCRMNLTQSRWLPVLLLTCSNLFMTFAWYGHLKFKSRPLFAVILASWGIAFFEYVLQVPANRWGSSVYSATQLKILQEFITLTVFGAFATFYLGEGLRWNHLAAFGCLLAAVAFAFLPTV